MTKDEHITHATRVPAASRRTMLMGLAAAASISAPALAQVDPIHALIAEHIEAVKAAHQAIKAWGAISVSLPEYDVAGEAVKKTGDRSHRLLMKLLSAKPTTLEGVAALLAHVGRPEFFEEEPEYPDCRETLLSSMNGYSSHELKRRGQDFPVRLAETLRGLIAGVRS
jgi:hypothetical protein